MRITKSSFENGLVFFIGLFWFAHIRVVGDLFFSELALILVFLSMFKRHGYKLYEPMAKRILFFGLLWLIGQVLTDIIQMTSVSSLAKGWASIIFFLLDFSAMYMLIYKDEKRLRLMILGFALGSILKCFVSPGYGFDGEPWKFGFAFPTMILTILLLSWLLRKRLIANSMLEFGLVMMGVLSIYLNSRSLGGTMILTALILFISRNPIFYSLLLKRISSARKIILVVLVSSSVFVILSGYQWAGESGVLPENAQEKYDLNAKASFGVLGLLLAGRNEFLASIPAVMDSPLIGHGSWAEDPKYRLFLYEINSIMGVDRDEAQLTRAIEEKDSIPAHSHLMQSWVWAGILGAAFWVMVLFLIAKVIVLSIRVNHVFTPLVVFIGIKAIWDLLFSPFSSVMRFQWGWELVLIILSYEIVRRSLKDKANNMKTDKLI